MSLIDSSSQVQLAYEPTLWAKVLHSVPHVNITLHPLEDDRFNPEDELYLESIGILSSLPALWLIASLLTLLIYLLSHCCCNDHSHSNQPQRRGGHSTKKHTKSRPLRCCLSFLSLLCIGSLALGFVGNHRLHSGLTEFVTATENVNQVIRSAQGLTSRVMTVLHHGIDGNLSHLYDGPFRAPGGPEHGPPPPHLLLPLGDSVFYNVSEAVKAVEKVSLAIDEDTAHVDFNFVTLWAQRLEAYRWPLTMASQGLFTLFCLLLFVGAIIHSRCVLIIFSVLGLFSIIILWLLSSVYITAAVAFADLCYDPTPWIMHVIREKVPREISAYYLQCTNSNPFEQSISISQRAVANIDKQVRQIVSTARSHYSPDEISPYIDDLESSSERVVQLMREVIVSLKCDQIFRSYNTALVSICDSGLLGVILMLISAAVSGLLFTILVWCNSHTWIYFKHKGRYTKVDDQDPYMPLSTTDRSRGGGGGSGSGVGGSIGIGLPPSAISNAPYRRTIHTPPQTPPYHGTLNGHSSTAAVMPYGQIGRHHHQHNATLMPQSSGSHLVGTLNRNTQSSSSYGHRGIDTLPSTMTLGRRGHYASLRNHSRDGGESVPAGPNTGQYATLSKQCKTLESSDFY